MRFPLRLPNLKGELFFDVHLRRHRPYKARHSLILTRLLNPEAYGVFTILLSFLFMVELMSDVDLRRRSIRHPRGDEVKFVHTVWTIRLLRCAFNFCLIFLGAPVPAAIYHAPVLTSAFRLFSFWS